MAEWSGPHFNLRLLCASNPGAQAQSDGEAGTIQRRANARANQKFRVPTIFPTVTRLAIFECC
jgi:hypothetical protein